LRPPTLVSIKHHSSLGHYICLILRQQFKTTMSYLMAFYTQLSRMKLVFAFMLKIILTLVKMITMIKIYKKNMKVDSLKQWTWFSNVPYWQGLLYQFTEKVILEISRSGNWKLSSISLWGTLCVDYSK